MKVLKNIFSLSNQISLENIFFQHIYIQPFAVLTDGWFFKERDVMKL